MQGAIGTITKWIVAFLVIFLLLMIFLCTFFMQKNDNTRPSLYAPSR